MSSKNDKNPPPEFQDTFMLECSRLQATEKFDKTNSKWRNDCGNGIECNVGDSIEVSTAYLNANGAGDGANSISFDGNFLGKSTDTGRWSDSDFNFNNTFQFDTFDNKTKIKINFYKNNDGLCCLRLPMTTFTKVYEDTPDTAAFDTHNIANQYVPVQTATNETGNFVKAYIIDNYNRVFDGKRMTIYKRDTTKDNVVLSEWDGNEAGYFMWYEYEEFIDLETDKGFNNCNNVAQDITIQLNTITNEYLLNNIPRKQLSATNFRLENTDDELNIGNDRFKNTTMIKETNCFKTFNCATRYTACSAAYKEFVEQTTNKNVYRRHFDWIATKYVNFRNAGLRLGLRWAQNKGPDNPVIKETINAHISNTWVQVSEQFWNERELYFNWLDTQQREDGLLEKLFYNSNTERFLHISCTDGYDQRIGSDIKFLELSHIVKLHINQTYYGIETEASKEAPWKGWLAKIDNEYYIKISTPQQGIKYPITADNRNIGYDRAFSGYGNESVALFNGMNHMQDPNATIKLTAGEPHPLNALQTGGEQYYTDITIDRIYLGSFPKLKYNSIENKFEFSDLHLGRTAGNTPYSLSPIAAYAAQNSVNDNAGNNYYYINPYDHPIIYHPHIRPLSTVANPPNFPVFPQTGGNYNVPRWTIFDALCGIGIKLFGISDNNNLRNFWYVLGFKNIIPDLNVSKYTTLIRNNFNIVSYPFTTNAQVESADIIEYSGNLFGASYFTPQPPVLQQLVTHSWTVGYTQIVLNANSSTFTADSIASKTNHGFYIIRSDMIGESKYISNGQLVNCVSIVSKENRIDDFLFMSSMGNQVYTFKKPCIIQNIKTEIFNNDNTPAVLDENNSVIYKITKATF